MLNHRIVQIDFLAEVVGACTDCRVWDLSGAIRATSKFWKAKGLRSKHGEVLKKVLHFRWDYIALSISEPLSSKIGMAPHAVQPPSSYLSRQSGPWSTLCFHECTTQCHTFESLLSSQFLMTSRSLLRSKRMCHDPFKIRPFTAR